MEKRFYIAYGSNLNVPRMRARCPRAEIAGVVCLKDMELLFKGSKTGAYLTIEKKKNGKVPAVVWEVTPEDEAALDRCEGFPFFYYKKDFRLEFKDARTGEDMTVTAFAYVMHEDRPAGVPTADYMRICLEGYRAFGFDTNRLFEAYGRRGEAGGDEG